MTFFVFGGFCWHVQSRLPFAFNRSDSPLFTNVLPVSGGCENCILRNMSSIHWCFYRFGERNGAGCRAEVPVFTGVSPCLESGAGDPAGGGTSRIFTTQLRGEPMRLEEKWSGRSRWWRDKPDFYHAAAWRCRRPRRAGQASSNYALSLQDATAGAALQLSRKRRAPRALIAFSNTRAA